MEVCVTVCSLTPSETDTTIHDVDCRCRESMERPTRNQTGKLSRLLSARAEERAPRLRPNRDHKVIPATANACHLCGESAGADCPQCHLPVCEEHREALEPELAALFGVWACQECTDRSRAELALDRQQWERKRTGDVVFRTCGVCGEEFSQVLAACSQCGKRLCHLHRTRYRRRFRFGQQPGEQTGGWYWDYEVRCQEHRLAPLLARLRGWQPEPAPGATESGL